MKKQGMAMAALVTAMMLGVSSIPEGMCIKAYNGTKETEFYNDDLEIRNGYYDEEDYDDEDYDYEDYDYEDYDEEDYDYEDYDEEDYDDEDYDEEDYDDEDYNEFEFIESEYEIKISKSAKSYSDCGMDFVDELNFDSDEYDAEDIEWSVDDESVATVDEEGYVTAVAPGSVILTASLDGQETDCEVTVPYPTCKLNKTKATIKREKK